MGTSSTNVENPVNQIANLLVGDATQPAEETQEAIEATEETLEVSDESQPQEESLAPEDEQPAESSDEEGIDTLNNLASELDIPIEDMYALNFKLSRGENLPEGGEITLGELKTFYEKNADIDSLREQIKTRELELTTQSEKVSEIPKVSNELMQARAQVMAIQQAYESTDWNGMRFSNPGEYAALQADFRNKFDMAKNQETTATQEFEDHKRQGAVYQQERLFEAHPELKDDKVRAQVAVDIQAFASKFGITPKEVEAIDDHRIMRMLIAASKTEAAKVAVKDKREVKTPSTNKPAARKSLPGRNAALKRLTEKAKATGDRKDQTNAVAELLSGS